MLDKNDDDDDVLVCQVGCGIAWQPLLMLLCCGGINGLQ